MNKCIIYIKTIDLDRWNTYMWNLRTNEPTLPPTFKTALDLMDEHHDWIQMIVQIDDLQRIYDLMDEYAVIAENFNKNNKE